ncbi:L-fucose:H+ symporter permease [Limnovirga soli]|uniref:L-fucose:H+ symporter permease n=1 Tax=Limnovirga soli TaxID=2656915 RepID=A0A8J8JSG4_9BACT|nr:L-fucose:H+ symporter permease [Limnovirga soli]NNV54050.1 L-fucose:H+ symporter permease [Limnovirga soli]
MPKPNQQATSNTVAFALITSLFFLWAFLHNINPILIPHLKKACQLTDTQSSLIDTAVYFGYFTIALPAGWFMHKYGYKKGILIGLLLYATGAALFIPAASSRSYEFFLFALFISASGATFLETVANPYITKLGDKSTSEQRLNFAQSFNGVGAFIAPIIGGQFILSGIEHTPAEMQQMTSEQFNSYLSFEAGTIKIPYMIIAGIVLLVAILFVFTKLPEIKEEDAIDDGHGHKSFSVKVFRHSHVSWAVIAEFFYVGAQVGVGSFFIRFSRYTMDLPEREAAYWWGFAMVGFMLGRFAGTFLMKYIKPQKLLAAYAIINILLLTVALTTSGSMATYALLPVPFFMSIMFPTIFALGIKGLGEESKIASSFLVMSIVGGGIIPFIMGKISDSTNSIQSAYIVPLICFAFIFYFGWKAHKIKAVA